MKNIRILNSAIIVEFRNGASIKLPGKLEYADTKYVQTKDGSNYHTVTINDFNFSYENMPFSMKVN